MRTTTSLLVLGLLAIVPAHAHVVEDLPALIFPVGHYVAAVKAHEPLVATHQTMLMLNATMVAQMHKSPDANAVIEWAALQGNQTLQGAFMLHNGQRMTNATFPTAGRWDFHVRIVEGETESMGNATLLVLPHLGYAPLIDAPVDDPAPWTQFDITFHFVPEPEHPAPGPEAATVRIERRDNAERVANILSTVAATRNPDGTWTARTSIPSGGGLHLSILAGDATTDTFTPYSLESGAGKPTATASTQDAIWIPWIIGGLVVGVCLLLWRRRL